MPGPQVELSFPSCIYRRPRPALASLLSLLRSTGLSPAASSKEARVGRGIRPYFLSCAAPVSLRPRLAGSALSRAPVSCLTQRCALLRFNPLVPSARRIRRTHPLIREARRGARLATRRCAARPPLCLARYASVPRPVVARYPPPTPPRARLVTRFPPRALPRRGCRGRRGRRVTTAHRAWWGRRVRRGEGCVSGREAGLGQVLVHIDTTA